MYASFGYCSILYVMNYTKFYNKIDNNDNDKLLNESGLFSDLYYCFF